ncbi:hypothetical protein ONS96_014284 [Cadophora gregata f. sp. sojae]|nr:hypothetical protein ONS96_014284 [Cadophora gregata f. sp. sojae]
MAKPQPPNRNLTPLAEAIQVFPVPGNNSLFTATIAWDWCGACVLLKRSALYLEVYRVGSEGLVWSGFEAE